MPELVESALQIVELGLPIRFDIVGGSDYTAKLEQELKAKVIAAGANGSITFHGSVPNPTDFYKNADLLVVPSIFEEPAANVVLEAKRQGVPAIVFPSGGLPELVTEGETGWVCPKKDVNSLTGAIKNVFAEASQLPNKTSSVLDEYAVRFGEARFAEQWADVYEN